MTTINDLSIASALAYGDSQETLGPDWILHRDSGEYESGYRGFAFYHTTLGDIIISCRGTRPGNLTDILGSDVPIVLGWVSQSKHDATNFARQVINETRSIGDKIGSIFLTGHSLGGAEAAYAAIQLEKEGIDVEAITFNAPGLPAENVKELKDKTELDVVDISCRADFVHKFGGPQPDEHLQLPCHLTAERQKPSFLAKWLTPLANVMAGFKAHKNAHLREFFRNHPRLSSIAASDASELKQRDIRALTAPDVDAPSL